MGRPEPCVLFAQTFVHPHLDEYVDEVLFAEPIVITACEFLEHNASSASQAVPLLGATLPPSFALEVFVQCEGETRFRRLCQPFLYSPSSSNVLEVEAVVTNHLVVRGSYRSLSLVIYGNTAEDLGQFNIEFDDSSITNLVSSAEGKLEDLPLALHSTNRTIEDSLSPPNTLYLPVTASDLSIEVKQLLQLTLKICELPNLGDAFHKVVSTVVSAATCYVTCSWGRSSDCGELRNVLSEGRTELIQLYKSLKEESGVASAESLDDCDFISEDDLITSKQLVDCLNQFLCFNKGFLSIVHHQLPQDTNVMMGLSVALLLCSGRESCFHFVSSGGMEQLVHVFSRDKHNSTATTLLLLGVIEKATQHSFGCEGFLGWWPREDENILSGVSDGYSRLLNLLLQKQRHDVASCATYVLHRLRFYEVTSRFEYAALSVLGGLSTNGRVTSDTYDMLICAQLQLKKLLKLITSRDPIEDPSPVASATRKLIIGQTEGLLSYKASNNLIASSNCCFSNRDIELHLLELLKERGFLPLAVALLSSSILRSEAGRALDIFVEVTSSIEAIILALLFCRSGLIFLLQHPELSATIIYALRGGDNVNKDVCLPLRYATVSISKGFFCVPQEVGIIVGMHLRVVNAIDRLLTAAPNSEEFLWMLWELCAVARSDCGREALLALGYFPEAVKILIEALHSAKEPEPLAKNNGASPLNLAIFHSVAEIFEVIVSDSTASSLGSWIGHVTELHKALYSSSPGSNRKDAPTRMLEWIDAGVVYHKNGVAGLLRYAAVIASGGDAHLNSTIPLVSDLTDAESVIGDSCGASDVNVLENLGKFISDKTFDGLTLRDSSVAQLTTALRILAFISENSTVAATLYDEGAIAIVYAVLVNCRFMLERSSNSYDYLVDEGTECNSTSDLLLERNREQSLVDLLVPTLVLLVNLLQKLKEVQEQHRNTKFLNALLRLHREVSPKLAACAADLSSPYPDSAIGFGALCHLLVSALACWPVFGWTPGLFHHLLDSVHVTSLLALGPKETCSLLCLMNDLFPEEGVWLWKDGMPLLSALRKLAVGTLLGPEMERQVNWYLHPTNLEKLLSEFTQHLDKIAQIIQHYAISELVVIQDLLRVFVIRIACQKIESCSVLLRPILSWIHAHAYEMSSPSDMDAYKVHRYLDFIASLLEHPHAKALLLKEGVIGTLTRVLDRCLGTIDADRITILAGRSSSQSGFPVLSWSRPVFKSFSLISISQASLPNDLHKFANMGAEDSIMILKYLLRFCQVLSAGKELLACLAAFKDLGSCSEGRSALASSFNGLNYIPEDRESYKGHLMDGNGSSCLFNESEWRKCPPLLLCCKTLLRSADSKDGLSSYAIEAVRALCMGCLWFCLDGERLNSDGVIAVKFLFGLPDDIGSTDGVAEENLNYIHELISVLTPIADDYVAASDIQILLYEALESAKSLMLLLQKPSSLLKMDDIFSSDSVPVPPNVVCSSKIHLLSHAGAEMTVEYQGALGDQFQWECPETLPDRLSQSTLSGKRKMSSLDGPNRRARGENSMAEVTTQTAFARGPTSNTAPSAPTRRDAFRQRKPNTSRPPSMHVDDYVARERNDGVSNSNVIAIPRVGSSGGRPPSMHVDEFMARERERQNPLSTVVGDVKVQVKSSTPVNDSAKEKFNKPKQLKADLDDDLQIDIVFDGEECEPDDKLPFPQPDDILQQPAPVVVEQSSPHSIVEETESDVHSTPLTSIMDENTQSEFSSRMSVSRPELPLTREPSVSSDKKYFEHSDESNNVTLVKASSGFESASATNSPRFPGFCYNNSPGSSAQWPVDSRMNPHNFFPKNSPQHIGNVPVATGSAGYYDPRFLPNQPPLPPMPPPSTVAALIPQTPDTVPSQSSPFLNSMNEGQQPSTTYQIRSDYPSAFNNGSSSRSSVSSPSGARPPPPLPRTPPPYNSTPNRTSISQSTVFNQSNVGTTELPQGSTAPSGTRINAYSPPALVPHMVFNRPGSNSMAMYGHVPTRLQGDNPNMLQNLSVPQSPMQSIHSGGQLQPLQPPQLPGPPQPPQHLRPPIQASQQFEQGSLQSPVPVHSLQMLQQPMVSPMQAYYQSQQQEFAHLQQQVDYSQPQVLPQSGDASSQQQQDPAMSLQEYFKSPEAIQSLLGDREKLCQVLEQHPKLMQMLQEKLGAQL
ncbi:protein virilizer homolog [Argentina anserina]|uniref:protein virilizer homolog n=1 Tax=Argentina anserina TaxID=57926 RepID=UPI002176907F|nr:protein virilizer homolog [Potentilla anserina]